MLHMIYPQSRMVSEDVVVIWAFDALVNAEYNALPREQREDDKAMEELMAATPKPSLDQAIEILEDMGLVTFKR